jgi:hypothetical protein
LFLAWANKWPLLRPSADQSDYIHSEQFVYYLLSARHSFENETSGTDIAQELILDTVSEKIV